MSTTVDNKEIKYRAFEYIPYVANPIDIDQQYMNIYVPDEYFNNGTVNGYNTQTAPIFMPNARWLHTKPSYDSKSRKWQT